MRENGVTIMDLFESVRRQVRFIADVNARQNPAPTWAIPSTSDATRQTYCHATGLEWTPTYTPTWTPDTRQVDERPTRANLPEYLTRPSAMGVRLTWPAGYARQGRWLVRQVVDVVSREREQAQRLIELQDARYITSRNGGRVERARIAAGLPPTITGYAPTRESAWSEDSPREVVNARETRAAERGRGNVKRGPSAARVTTRDNYAPTSTLRMLHTVGIATHPAASTWAGPGTAGDYTPAILHVLANPMQATYRLRASESDAGTVLPVHVDDTPTSDDTPAHVEPAHVQAALDARLLAGMSSVHVLDAR